MPANTQALTPVGQACGTVDIMTAVVTVAMTIDHAGLGSCAACLPHSDC